MQSDLMGDILRSLIASIPSIIVYSLGIIFALVQMRKAPRAAVILVISLLVLGLLSIARPIAFVFVGRMQDSMNWFSIVALALQFIYLGGIVGLILAVFCDRAPGVGISDPFAIKPASPSPSDNPYISPSPVPPFGGPPKPPR